MTFVNDIQSATAQEMFIDFENAFLLSASFCEAHANSVVRSCNNLRLVLDRFATIEGFFKELVQLTAKLKINYILHITNLVISTCCNVMLIIFEHITCSLQ